MIKTLLFFSCLFFAGLQLFAQEQLIPMSSNPVLENYWNHQKNSDQRIRKVPGDTLQLPFVDDFSKKGIFPDQSLWLDSNVYINSNYPINPPSVGVATFDGVNKFGVPYDELTVNANGHADSLTSHYIN